MTVKNACKITDQFLGFPDTYLEHDITASSNSNYLLLKQMVLVPTAYVFIHRSNMHAHRPYFLIHQLKHGFWLLKRTISFETVLLSTHNMFCLRNKKNNFQLRSLIERHAYAVSTNITCTGPNIFFR